MALIVNAAYVAEWKVRSRVVARHELWSHQPGADYLAGPPSRRERKRSLAGIPAREMSTRSTPITRRWFCRFRAVRGSSSRRTGTAPPWRVREWMFDPSRELFEGTGEIEQSYPFLASMGPFRLRSGERLLDDEWRYDQIGACRRRGDPAADSQPLRRREHLERRLPGPHDRAL